MTLQLLDLPLEVIKKCSNYLYTWERFHMSYTCRAFRHVAPHINHGSMDQVENKHYMLLQLMDQYREWMELRRMDENGIVIVFAPKRFTRFVRSENQIKRRLNRDCVSIM